MAPRAGPLGLVDEKESYCLFSLSEPLLHQCLIYLDTEALLNWRTCSRTTRGMFATTAHGSQHIRRLMTGLHHALEQLKHLSSLGPSKPLHPSSLAVVTGEEAAVPQPNSRRVVNIGHKGACGHVEGNTLRSFIEAVRLGVDVIEFDVISCLDGAVLCHHDPVHEASEVWYSHVPSTVARRLLPNVCTLEEMLRCTELRNAKHVDLYFDLKHTNIVKPTMRLVHRAVLEWGWESSRIIMATFKPMELLEINAWRSALPELSRLRTAIILDGVPLALGKDFAAIGVDAISIGQHNVGEDLLQDCHRRGMKVWVWTVNSPFMMDMLLKQGVDGVCSDYPERVAAAKERVFGPNANDRAASVPYPAERRLTVPSGHEAHAVLSLLYSNLGEVRDALVAHMKDAKSLLDLSRRDCIVCANLPSAERQALQMLLTTAEGCVTLFLERRLFGPEGFQFSFDLTESAVGKQLLVAVDTAAQQQQQSAGQNQSEATPTATAAATIAVATPTSPKTSAGKPALLPFEKQWIEMTAARTRTSVSALGRGG